MVNKKGEKCFGVKKREIKADGPKVQESVWQSALL